MADLAQSPVDAGHGDHGGPAPGFPMLSAGAPGGRRPANPARPWSLGGCVRPGPGLGQRPRAPTPRGPGAPNSGRPPLQFPPRHGNQDGLGGPMAASPPGAPASTRNYGRLVRWIDYRLPFVA